MLPLKPFSLINPAHLLDLKELFLKLDGGYKVMAGGTDLLPNLKHGLYDIDHVIGLNNIAELKGMHCSEERIELGALTRLCDIAESAALKKSLPALVKASLHIASPQIRNMGTLGGNICLDTRCLYFNQTQFWRHALGYCLKKDGSQCHVVKEGKRCVAASSNDLATVLLAYDAEVSITSPSQDFTLKLDNFYTANGEKNNNLLPHEIVSKVTVNIPLGSMAGFCKLRPRQSIDFAILSTAVQFSLTNNRFNGGRLVVNALVAKPKVLDLAEFVGLPYSDAVIEISRWAEKKCHPQTNICDDPGYRKQMVSWSVTTAFLEACSPME